MVSKLMIVDLEIDFEDESFVSLDFVVFFFFVDYILVDDGDVDFFFVLKIKLKIN